MDEREEAALREKLERLRTGSKQHRHEEPQVHERKRNILDNRYIFLSIVVLIFLVNIVLRMGLAHYTGFFEPDGFFHYAVLGQAIANHYIVPANQTISGFPSHNGITEPNGLYYMTLIPYSILKYVGISYYNIERYISVLFGVLDAVGAYFLAKYITNSRTAGLISMLFISISSGDIARTAALVYRGDTFVTIFVLLALIFFAKSALESRPTRQYIYAALSGLVLGTAAAIWGGAPFGVVIYIGALAVLIVYAFLKASERLLWSGFVLSLGLLLSYIVEWIYLYANVIRYVPSLGSIHFFIFLLPLLLGSLLAYYVIKKKDGTFSAIAETWQKRAVFVIIAILVVFGAVSVLFYGYFTTLASSAFGTGSLGTTIQELQRPSLLFVWDSFSYQLILAPIGLLLALIFGRKLAGHDKAGMANVALIAVAVYFLVTIWLQYSAIRYNSLVAPPIAILAACTVYILPKLFLGKRRLFTYVSYFFVGLFIALIALNISQTYVNSYTSGQADGINNQFLAAMAWMYNNTPTSATVLALWPDGSVVEGWAHRQSYMDSVNGQTNSKIYNFSRWLFSQSPDAQYLLNASRPQYFVVRNYWVQELGGIAAEGEIANASPYGYEQMSSLHIQQANNGTTVYFFNSSAYPYYSVDLVEQHPANSTARFVALFGSALSQGRVPLSSVIFVNQTGGPYSIALPGLNNTLNFSFVMFYQGSTITGGAILGPTMPRSNFFRFVDLCSLATCPYNDSGVTMQVVYQNSDTKIIKINYP